jgi:hypothetical protein
MEEYPDQNNANGTTNNNEEGTKHGDNARRPPSLSLKDLLPTLQLPPDARFIPGASSSAGTVPSGLASGYSTPSASAKISYPNLTRSGSLLKTTRKSGYLEIR